MSNKAWDLISYGQSSKSISGVDGRPSGEVIDEIEEALKFFTEPVKPEAFGAAIKGYACPRCMKLVDVDDVHCRHCGAKFDWSENEL